MFVAILIFIVILGLLVFVHELGHFVVARRNGVKAPEFGFGFPPRIVGFQFLREVPVPGKKKKLFSKWRIIWGGKDGDDENEVSDLTEAHEKKLQGGTIYSLNWFPLGGFVRIKGEDGGNAGDEDSFASKSAWKRVKILAAGVTMNFVFAWLLLSIVFMFGAPRDIAQLVDKSIPIKISEVSLGSPAEQIGIKIGDEIIKKQKTGVEFSGVNDFIAYVNANKGKIINLEIKRDKTILSLSVTPRVEVPAGQGSLGIGFASDEAIDYPWYEAIWYGLVTTCIIAYQIFASLGILIGALFTGDKAIMADVSGPVGIVAMAKQALDVGFTYVALLTALISINLGIINILPIPALDGGRILFVLIEKIKGSPVSQKVEQTFHTIFFALLMLLMLAVTYKDIAKLF